MDQQLSPSRARGANSCLTLIGAGIIAFAPAADARTTKIQLSPPVIAFGGYSFPGVGQYEVITGIATGEADPNDPQNAVITDIQLAPRNAKGHVVYQHNFYILKPLNLRNGNHQMMYEPPNRGGKTYQTLNNTPSGTNDPAAIIDQTVLANSFLWPRGYTTVWSGWENNLGPLDSLTATASLPVAHNRDGSTITGPGYEYIVSPPPPGATYTLAYPAASGSQTDAKLTHRIHLDDTPSPVPASGWAYTDANNTAIKLTTRNFIPNDIYEFSYLAKDPTINGLGLAAIRDFTRFCVTPQRMISAHPIRLPTTSPGSTPRPRRNPRARSTTSRISVSTRMKTAGKSSTA
jgi:hypothetical protein